MQALIFHLMTCEGVIGGKSSADLEAWLQKVLDWLEP